MANKATMEMYVKVWNSAEGTDWEEFNVGSVNEGLDLLAHKIEHDDCFYRAEIWYNVSVGRWILQTSVFMH